MAWSFMESVADFCPLTLSFKLGVFPQAMSCTVPLKTAPRAKVCTLADVLYQA